MVDLDVVSPSLKDDENVTNTPIRSIISVQRNHPPPEKAQDIRQRSLIIFSFWAIVIFLGLPIWWRTTTIYRAKLPLSTMMDWADGRVSSVIFPTGEQL